MIVFTLTNTITEQVFVGTTTDSADERWEQIQAALPFGLEGKLYKEMRDLGVDSFVLKDFAVAYDRDDMKELFKEAMETHNGVSLQGLKTTIPKVAKAPVKRTSTAGKKTLTASPRKTSRAPKEKLSSGRVSSAAKERAIKAAIEEEKAQRAMKQQRDIVAEAAEMKAIMAKLDAKAASVKKR